MLTRYDVIRMALAAEAARVAEAERRAAAEAEARVRADQEAFARREREAAEARAMAAADMTTYTLTITEQQARTISTACELMARLGMGQWPEALSHLPMQDSKRGGDHISALLPYMAGLLVDGIDGWGSHLGIRGARTPETARTAWDLYAVIRHRLAWDAAVERGLTAGEFRNWRTMGGVHYDDPEHIGKEPLATIERAPTT